MALDVFRPPERLSGTTIDAEDGSAFGAFGSGRPIELPDAQLEEPVGSLACPAHALPLKPPADGQIDVLLDRP
jgi:hypothetical protein